ncbi:protein of unknown function [Streptomyces murinus]
MRGGHASSVLLAVQGVRGERELDQLHRDGAFGTQRRVLQSLAVAEEDGGQLLLECLGLGRGQIEDRLGSAGDPVPVLGKRVPHGGDSADPVQPGVPQRGAEGGLGDRVPRVGAVDREADVDPPPGAAATGAAGRLLHEAVLRQGAQMKSAVRRGLPHHPRGLGRGQWLAPVEGFEQGQSGGMGDGPHGLGVGELAGPAPSGIRFFERHVSRLYARNMSFDRRMEANPVPLQMSSGQYWPLGPAVPPPAGANEPITGDPWPAHRQAVEAVSLVRV